MKKTLFLYLIIFSFPLLSQTEWQKLTATKASDFGLSYTLPKTIFFFDSEYLKTTYKAGPYFRYAEKFLGITNAIMKDSVAYNLENIVTQCSSIPDKNSACMVQLKSGDPYILLNKEGILCAVNTNADTSLVYKIKSLPQYKLIQSAIENSNLTLSEETLASGSIAKTAELAAKQILRLRESRTEILTGESDKMPKDGEGLKILLEQLDKQEKALTSLFVGTIQKEVFYARTRFIPTDLDLNHFVIFRFSKHFGLIPAEDLSGEPIYIDIKATDRKVFLPADPKKKVDEKRGLIYNIPGKGNIKVTYNSKVFVDQEYTFTQFGIQANFPTDLFTRKKMPAKVVIHPETGAIVSLLQ